MEQAASETKNTETRFGVWPENQLAVIVFQSACTQWNRVIGPSGGAYVSGLNYASIPPL
ncbi:DUF1799 domain-containing protein, partial [Propionivibrio sp.]|uniref:DUF1799 domain-containing protein n=1 Tax=Propionivibrio sp. TaxID=2212460 RepID=UPI003BEFEDD6